MSKVEFRKAMQMLGLHAPQEEVDRLYDGFDPDRSGSVDYKELNAKLRLLTIRHAMVDQLKAPPAGLEGAVLAHFKTQRRRILRQCWAWTEEAPVELRGKMRAAVAQLHAVLPKAE